MGKWFYGIQLNRKNVCQEGKMEQTRSDKCFTKMSLDFPERAEKQLIHFGFGEKSIKAPVPEINYLNL